MWKSDQEQNFSAEEVHKLLSDDVEALEENDHEVLNEPLNFSPPKKWTFDDGSDLGNYNTQQHWVRHPRHGLWLVYTRKGAGNDHVFRHRAPLFIAKVDPEKLHIIRSTEQILVPEKGARLGNFGVTEISENETWVTAAEWMQGPPPNHHDPKPLIARGADNRIWVAKVKWTLPPAPIIQRYGDSFTRSATAPETMVAAVAANMAWNKKSVQ